MYGQDRSHLRRVFLTSWSRHQAGHVLAPLEKMIVAIVEQHPEYQRYLTENHLDRDWQPEAGGTNPFLHLAMHLSVAEQLANDRPQGVRVLYTQIAARQSADTHAAEHQIMECLERVLWEAQRAGKTPDEEAFLQQLRDLAKR
jgi:hypothetical protein